MSVDAIIVTVVFACCATAHFVGMFLTGILARHRVQYLSLAWILAIFFVVIAIVAMFGKSVADGRPGLLNPYMLLMLVVGSYLQSIYSLGLVMPGFLQWGRMLRYAAPVLVLAVVYVIAIFPAGQLTTVYSSDELFQNILSLDLILRLVALFLGVFYVVNIVILPRRLAYKTTFPLSLIAYTAVLILSVVLYFYTALNYTPMLLCSYMVIFTLSNFFWVCHSIEVLVTKIPHPDISMNVEEADLVDKVEEASSDAKRQEDFNEMNQKRYMRVQLWMQGHKAEWMSNGFTRDKLCEETGINRQLMLQCLRSQGHNNIHDYITTYRIEELKRLVQVGRVGSVSDCVQVGFATAKTARSCFERIEGRNLDDYIAQMAG